METNRQAELDRAAVTASDQTAAKGLRPGTDEYILEYWKAYSHALGIKDTPDTSGCA